MSWKMYYLGNTGYASYVVNAAMPILESLGYEPSYTNISNAQGRLSVKINGEVYEAVVTAQTSSWPTYMFVNDETNDILISASINAYTDFNQIAYFAILSGTNLLTGEFGLFPIESTNVTFQRISNAWLSDTPPEVMVLQKAVFFKSPNSSYTDNVKYNFESSLYFGSHINSTGTIVTVGEDSFVCINGRLYAKL